jgi:hypothetical protein
MSELLRERKRKRLLTGIAAGLVPVALTANFITYWGSSAPTTAADLVATAVPVKEVVPIGQALYCQVTAMLWEGLTDAERAQKVTALGKIAGQQGYEAVVVVDENRRELARWSARSGPEAAPVVAR